MIQPARTAAIDAEALWGWVVPVMCDRRPSFGAKLVYIRCWFLSRFQGGQIVVTTHQLGFQLGGDPRSVRRWLRELEKYLWLEVVNWQPDGPIYLNMERPTRLDLPRRFVGDPQPPLPGMYDEEERGQPCAKLSAPPDSLAQNCPRPPAHPDGSPEGRSGAGDGRASMDMEHRRSKETLHGDGQDREQLLTWLVEAIDDPKTEPSIFGRAVDLVLYHGVAEKRLKDLVDMVCRKRRDGKIRTSPGRLFLTGARRLAVEHGIRWDSLHPEYPAGQVPTPRPAATSRRTQDPARPLPKDDPLTRILNPEP